MNEFILLSKIKWLINYSDKYILSNFPKVHISLKIKLQDNLYDLLENTIRANVNKGNIRNKYQKEILVNLSILDYYIGLMLERTIIKKNRFNSFINALLDIRKITYGWIENE